MESVPYVNGIHIEAICDHLMHLKEIKNLIICLPRRHSKTLLTDVHFPAWTWANDPTARFIFGHEGAALAEDASVKCRTLIKSPLYQSYYSDVFKLSEEQNTKKRFNNDKGGFRMATSPGAAGVGFGGEFLIVDDPLKPEDSNSKAAREAVINWYTGTFYNLTNKDTCRLIVMQRLHAEDLAGHIIGNDKADNWTKLIIPLEYSSARTVVSKLGWKDPRTTEGEILCPERMGREEIEERKNTLLKHQFEAQFNQNPLGAGSYIFNADDLQYYDDDGGKIEDSFRFMAVDLAISGKSTADYTAIVVADITAAGQVFVRFVQRERIGSVGLVDAIEKNYKRFKPDRVYVENAGFQQLIIDECRAKNLPVVGIAPQGDKVTRAWALRFFVESHNFFLPRDRTWVKDYIDEFVSWTGSPSEHDDQIDATAYICAEARKRVRVVRSKEEPKEKTPEEIEREERKRRWEALTYGT